MATRRMLCLSGLAGAFCLLIASQISFADSHVRIVRLSEIEGSVQIDRNTGQGFEKAIMNMPITEGMRIRTNSGRAEVEFENGSVLRLADDSSVQFDKLTRGDDGQMINDVRVNDGTVYVNYKHKAADGFRLEYAKDSLNLDRDVHFRLSVFPEKAQISVLKGELDVPENGLTAKLKKNETLNVNFNDQAQAAVAKGISSLPADYWDEQRSAYDSQYQDQYAKNKYPYQYGFSDLNYYGTFFNAPGYGMLWQPFGVTSAWNPFGDGAWAFYPGFGYMWVSGYPWGWTPYRYGNWLYTPSYGWAWQPGMASGWTTVNAYPTVVNAPQSWHHPAPPVSTALNSNSTVLVGNVGNPAMIHTWNRVAAYQQPNVAMTSGTAHVVPTYRQAMQRAEIVHGSSPTTQAAPSAQRGTTNPASKPSAGMDSAPASTMHTGSSGSVHTGYHH